MTEKVQVYAIEPVTTFGVGVPKQNFIVTPKLGQQMLSGDLQGVTDKYKLSITSVPPQSFDSVRADLARYSPVVVTRVAMRYRDHAYTGIIDSEGVPYFFALTTQGMVLRDVVDYEAAWRAFDKLMDAEHSRALEAHREKTNVDDLAVTSISTEEPALVVTKALKRKAPAHPGIRGGLFYFDKHGVVRYGHPSVPKSKHEVVEEHKAAISLASKSPFGKDDEVASEAFRHVKARAPQTVKELRKLLFSWLKKNYEGDIASDTQGLIAHFVENGAVTASQEPASEEPEEEPGAEKEPYWTTRSMKFAPPRPLMFQAMGTKLLVGGTPVVLSPEAEQAAYEYARRFIWKQGAVVDQAAFVKGFEKSLREMAKLPSGAIDYKHFLSRVNKEPPKEKAARGKKPLETLETHPHLFITQDGEPVRIMGALKPGGFFTGKDHYGAWAPPVREEDLTLNVSVGKAPPGWKGKILDPPDPTKDYLVTWRHPVTGDSDYIYTSRAKADIKKFAEAQVLGSAIPEIQEAYVSDITTAKDPVTKMAALCTWLIDYKHFRVGEEEYAKNGIHGIASVLFEHVKIKDTEVTFDFTGKKGEHWTRTVDLAKQPEALTFIKQCMKGKKKGERLWSGHAWSATSVDVNKYLEPFSRDGVKFTAKMFRTYHANAYMTLMIKKLTEVQEALGLSNADVKRLYKGYAPKDKAGTKLAKRMYKGQTIAQYLGFEEYTGSKGAKVDKTGVLPTVASKMGHTVGACRGNYIDPVSVVNWARERGWDERTPKEKKTREDLPGFTSEEE